MQPQRIQLLGNPYQARSLIASAQRCVNLFPEANAKDSPVGITHYPTPGTVLYSDPQLERMVRCTYRTSIGTAYVVIGPNVYFLDSNQTLSVVGFIADLPTQVIMADNGLAVVLVDGTNGYAIDMATNSFGQIIDPAFYAASFVVFLDTFFCFNRVATNQFFISLSMADFTMLTGGTAFDPLDIAAKSGSADPIVSVGTVSKNLWLIGELTTEVWVGTGSADFYFQQVQGAYINHGSIAGYSLASQDVLLFWLMQDKEGKNIVVQAGGNGEIKEISTPAIVKAFNSYETTADCIAFCYQKQDHAFVVFTFPTANRTWSYELTNQAWHELVWLDDNGIENRHRANCAMFVYGANVIGDWENGKLWSLEDDVYTDDGDPIKRIRTFPHLITNGNRNYYSYFMADISPGTYNPDPPDSVEPMISLRWSDDRGATYGNQIDQTLGRLGQFLTMPTWNRLGMSRDRIFELSWSVDANVALNGAFIEFQPGGS